MNMDIEANCSVEDTSLILSWRDVSVTASNGNVILKPVYGDLRSGEMLAVLGPSGAGKSTFLDAVSSRSRTVNTSGSITFNGRAFNPASVMSYVEQEDALLGVLTVQETITFAAKLSHNPNFPTSKREALVEETISTLGLSAVADYRIGTPIQRGVSGGQKRRVTIACSVVARPRILVLDEPTSGLDSKAAYEVLKSIKAYAVKQNMIVICTIHQPNWQTFSLFDHMLLLAKGKTIYRGSVEGLPGYLSRVGSPVAQHINPADAAISLVNTDFNRSLENVHVQQSKFNDASIVDSLADMWTDYERRSGLTLGKDVIGVPEGQGSFIPTVFQGKQNSLLQNLKQNIYRTGVLIDRNFTSYRRNLLAYGIRVGMYIAMGVLLATIWINMPQTDPHLNDRLSVHFFSVAFLSFMSVSGIPAFLEERAVFRRERKNGLYGPGAYVLANTIINLPFLFGCSVLFSVICYWSIGLHPGATHFFRFLAFIFIAVFTAESQSVLVAAILPIFVAALAIASFMNGFWMGYFIRAINLPRFWYYWAHWIDYQTFAFNILVANDLRGLVFPCTTLADGSCHCAYASTLVNQCAVLGEDVLNDLQIGGTKTGLYVGILLLITFVYRILFYFALVLRK